MALSNDNKKHFRQVGHGLKPVVMVAGNGLSENVLAEIERALEDHELIKVKVSVIDRELRSAAIKEMCDHSRAELIQEIGKVALIYRESKKPNLRTSNIR